MYMLVCAYSDTLAQYGEIAMLYGLTISNLLVLRDIQSMAIKLSRNSRKFILMVGMFSALDHTLLLAWTET